MNGKRRTRSGLVPLIVIAAITAALAAAFTPAARAEWSSSAYATANTAMCWTDRIDVDAPWIKAKFVGYGMVVGGTQWTTFQSVLQRRDPLGRWVDVYWSPWFQYEAMPFGQVDGNYFWYTDAAGARQYTTQAQSLPMVGRHGYFRYRLRVYWWDKYNSRWYGEESLVAEGMYGMGGVNDGLYRYRDGCYYP